MSKQISTSHDWEDKGYHPPYKVVKYIITKAGSRVKLSDVITSIDPDFDPDCELGICAVCGTKMQHNYVIEDSQGVLFAVGSECVKKRNDSELLVAAKDFKSSVSKAKIREDRHLAHTQHLAQKREQAARRIEEIQDVLAPIIVALKRHNTNRAYALVAQFGRGDLTLNDFDLRLIDEACAKYHVEDARDLLAQLT